MVNTVHKVISGKDAICFIIQTEGDTDFWYWEISRDTWNGYWKDKNPACLIGNIMEWAANEFVNSDECSYCGCSCASFETVYDAIKDYMEVTKMTVREFCLKKTQVNELCVIRDSGWIIATVWIDSEDLFSMNKRVAEMEVKSDRWGTLIIATEHGDKISIPCHYIDC